MVIAICSPSSVVVVEEKVVVVEVDELVVELEVEVVAVVDVVDTETEVVVKFSVATVLHPRLNSPIAIKHTVTPQ